MTRYQILVLVAFFYACAIVPHPPPKAFAPKAEVAAATPAPSKYAFANTVDVGPVDLEGMAAAYARTKILVEGGAKEITFRIVSPGGAVFVGLQWIRLVEDLKKLHEIHTTCVVDVMAYSMAAVILESSACDVRLATKRSTILFHNASVETSGNATELENTKSHLSAVDMAMALIISDRLGMPLTQYRARIAGKDWCMAVPEALAVHAIDGLVSPADIEPPAPDPAP